MNKQDFITKFGGVFEHSPWIAEHAFSALLISELSKVACLHKAMCEKFQNATHTEKLGVLKAHPDLAGKLAVAGELTASSRLEQSSAGLDQLSDDEFFLMQQLNQTYVEKNKFPFIIAVKGLNKQTIINAFQKRVNNPEDEEFETACIQVEKIALLRLQDLVRE